MVRLQSFVPTHDQKILSMKFISQDVLVLGMDNSSVSSKGKKDNYYDYDICVLTI